MINAIAAHKDELEKLLEDLSSDRVASGITFVALVDAYIMRIDTNCPDISAVNPPPAQIDGGLTFGTTLTQSCALYYAQHTTSEWRTALFQRFRAAVRKQAPDVHRRLPANVPSVQRFTGTTATDRCCQRVNPRMELKKSVASSEVELESRKRSARDKSRSKPKPLFGVP
jgi:hypothetical protein